MDTADDVPSSSDGETRYAYDDETRFRVTARRNKLLALWAARKLQMNDVSAEIYAKELVASTYVSAGQDKIIERIAADFVAREIAYSGDEIRQMVARFSIEAESNLSTN